MQDKIWVSDYWAILRSSNKLCQAELANSLGLKVPRTIATSSEIEAREFILDVKDVVVKMMGTQHVYDGQVSHVFYTAPINSEQLDGLNLSGLCVAPSIFQERIDKALDIRLTIVGNQAFPCEIHQHGNNESSIDWRSGIFEEGALSYCFHENMDPAIIDKCILMLNQMNLRYGAFDFVIDRNETYWFVEVNPNGQWAFIEEEAGISISKAFVDVFSGR